MIEYYMNDLQAITNGRLTTEELEEIKYCMACYAQDAIHDSFVEFESMQIAQKGLEKIEALNEQR